MLLGRQGFDAEGVCASKLVRFDRSDEAATWGFREGEAVWGAVRGDVSRVRLPSRSWRVPTGRQARGLVLAAGMDEFSGHAGEVGQKASLPNRYRERNVSLMTNSSNRFCFFSLPTT